LIDTLGVQQYAAFVLLSSLTGWYLLVDMGVGISLQNYISESIARNKPYNDLIAVAVMMSMFLLVLTAVLLYLASPYLAPVFLKQFTFMSEFEKARNFFVVGVLFIGACMGGIAYKIWYSEHKGYLSNILPAVCSLTGLLGIMMLKESAIQDRFYVTLIVYFVPSALIPMIILVIRLNTSLREAIGHKFEISVKIFKRAVQFWLFSILGATIAQVDYIIMSQYVDSKEIVTYSIATKVFGLAFFVYGSVLSALWPVFAKEITNNNWQIIKDYLHKYTVLGLIFMFICTLFLVWLMPTAVSILAPGSGIVVPTLFVILLGGYQMIRVWTDILATVLMSMSNLRVFWVYVPVQALINVALQVMLAPVLGIYGILVGLIVSFVLTAVWILPLTVRKYYRVIEQVPA